MPIVQQRRNPCITRSSDQRQAPDPKTLHNNSVHIRREGSRIVHLEERGVSVDYSTINRWAVKHSPQPGEAFHRRRHRCGSAAAWTSHTFVSEARGGSASCGRQIRPDHCFFAHRAPGYRGGASVLKKAIRHNGFSETITIDGSGANEAAINSHNEKHGTTIKVC